MNLYKKKTEIDSQTQKTNLTVTLENKLWLPNLWFPGKEYNMNLGLTDTHYHIQNRQTTKIYLQHLLSHFSHVQLCAATLWTVAHQVPLSMGFSRQEYWSGLPCPSPGDLPNPGIQPMSFMSPALAGRFFTTNPHGKPLIYTYICLIYLHIPYVLIAQGTIFNIL